MRAFIAALCLILWASVASAHKPSDSYLSVQTEGKTIHGHWDIALRDLDYAIGLDINGDAAITWGEVRVRQVAIGEYALRRLSILNRGKTCSLTAGTLQIDSHTDGSYAVIELSGQCAEEIHELTFDYRLFFDIDAQHRGLLNFASDGRSQSGIFSIDRPVQRFRSTSEDGGRQLRNFVWSGFHHIASGYDHILFLVALLLPAVLMRDGGQWRPINTLQMAIWNVAAIVTAFTLAHSITLSLAILGIAQIPSRLVESLIAVTVVATAIDNLWPILPRQRSLVAFIFGLIHGFGFAGAMLDLELARTNLAVSLIGFNLGVELGQLLLVLLLLPILYSMRSTWIYARLALNTGSLAITAVAIGWLIERSLKLEFMPF